MPLAASTHATPVLQHCVPHGVVPRGQQHAEAGSVHVSPLGQQNCPHACAPARQVSAPAREGRNNKVPAAAAPLARRTLRALRREVERAMARERSSNEWLMQTPPTAATDECEVGLTTRFDQSATTQRALSK